MPAVDVRHVEPDDPTLPQRCRPAIHFDEVIIGHANGLGQLEFSATAAGVKAHGKGAMDCETQQIVAFGIGPEEPTANLCPPARTHATVACVRHWR